MRKLLICGAVAAGMSMAAAPAHSYEGPWCLKGSLGHGFVAERCHFRTFEACREERPFLGSNAFCVQNPRFLPYWQGRGPDDQRRKVSRKKRYRG